MSPKKPPVTRIRRARRAAEDVVGALRRTAGLGDAAGQLDVRGHAGQGRLRRRHALRADVLDGLRACDPALFLPVRDVARSWISDCVEVDCPRFMGFSA